MFYDSEEALLADERISYTAAQHELARHGARIIAKAGNMIQVTNDIDPPDWIDCTTAGVLIWLGY